MNMLLRFALATALVSTVAAPAAAGELRLSMGNGRVTLIAKDVTVREILNEWARVGQTRIVNGEKLTGGPVTLELTDVPEAQALDAVLRSAAGYVMAPRLDGSPGSSRYDRIMILAIEPAAGCHREQSCAVHEPADAADAPEQPGRRRCGVRPDGCEPDQRSDRRAAWCRRDAAADDARSSPSADAARSAGATGPGADDRAAARHVAAA